MARVTFQDVPLRGKVAGFSPEGRVRCADGDQIEPVDVTYIGHDVGVPDPTAETVGYHSNFDYENGTVDVTIECDDAAYIAALETAINAIPNLRAAEIAARVSDENAGHMTTGEKVDSAQVRTAWSRGLEITQPQKNAWAGSVIGQQVKAEKAGRPVDTPAP